MDIIQGLPKIFGKLALSFLVTLATCSQNGNFLSQRITLWVAAIEPSSHPQNVLSMLMLYIQK